MKYLKCQYCERGGADAPQCRDCTRANGYKWFHVIGAQKIIDPEALWQLNLDNFKAGLLGDPKDTGTILRYWKAQELANYPSASENVQYFTDIVEKRQRSRERDHTETLLLFIKKYLHDILDEWYTRQDEPHFYENNIMVYNHVKKELDDLYAYAEKLGINLDEEEGGG